MEFWHFGRIYKLNLGILALLGIMMIFGGFIDFSGDIKFFIVEFCRFFQRIQYNAESEAIHEAKKSTGHVAANMYDIV
jgi:hypothetical protein